MQSAQPAERLDLIFHALSDARRREMIDRLSRGPATVGELARPLSMGMPSAVKHLALLERSRLVTSGKTGRARTFSLPPDAVSALEYWLNERKALWNRYFDQRDRLLSQTADAAKSQEG